ncbi:hypothetical protein [Cupriavidus sp. PET2-C1]
MAADDVDFDLDRRSFLKLGVAGTVVLDVAGVGAMLSGCSESEKRQRRATVSCVTQISSCSRQ